MSKKKEDAGTRTLYSVNMLFLPGDGSPRLVPYDYGITKRSYTQLNRLLVDLIERADEFGLQGLPNIDQIVIEYTTQDGKDTGGIELFNFANDRLVSISCSKKEVSNLILLPNEKQTKSGLVIPGSEKH